MAEENKGAPKKQVRKRRTAASPPDAGVGGIHELAAAAAQQAESSRNPSAPEEGITPDRTTEKEAENSEQEKEDPKDQPKPQPPDDGSENTSDGGRAGGTPPNGGSQVLPQEGTQEGTSPGTQLGRTEERAQVNDPGDQSESPMDFSMRAALAEEKDPEQDWIKTGWQAKRYRKAAVKVAIKFKWRGYKEEQDVIDAALAAYLPKELMDEAREMARRGEL